MRGAPMLYINYLGSRDLKKSFFSKVAREDVRVKKSTAPPGFEPETHRLWSAVLYQLSYGVVVMV